ncbi:hypothetical protein Tco_0409587 [Tanacetum coccineum]
MGKLNGPLAIQMMKGSVMEENYQGWFETFNNYKETDYEETIKEEREPNDDHGIDNLNNDLVRDNASYHANNEEYKENRCELLGNPRQELTVCEIRRFEIIKYSFGPAEKYLAIKECEYDDLTRTEDDACHAYQEIFRIMDEGWTLLNEENDLVEYLYSGILCVVVMLMSTENDVNPPAPNPAHNSNFSLLSVLGRERLTSPNYMDWIQNLRFTLRYENKEYVLDEQIPIIDDDST